jgi:hypothetical protein
MGNRQVVIRLLCYSNNTQALSAVVKTSALKHVDVPRHRPLGLPLADESSSKA